MHNLTPIYKPVTWCVDPAVIDDILDTSEQREFEREFGEQIVAAMHGRMEAAFTASLPVKRNRLAEEMGDEYLPAPTLDQFKFEIAMLRD